LGHYLFVSRIGIQNMLQEIRNVLSIFTTRFLALTFHPHLIIKGPVDCIRCERT